MYSCNVVNLKSSLNNKKWWKLHFIWPLQLFSLYNIYYSFYIRMIWLKWNVIKIIISLFTRFTWSFTETSLFLFTGLRISLSVTVQAQTLAVLLSCTNSPEILTSYYIQQNVQNHHPWTLNKWLKKRKQQHKQFNLQATLFSTKQWTDSLFNLDLQITPSQYVLRWEDKLYPKYGFKEYPVSMCITKKYHCG